MNEHSTALGGQPDDAEFRNILRPFDPREAASIADIAQRWHRTTVTVRRTARERGLGRKISGQWYCSVVAWSMFLDGDRDALNSYHAGDRTSPKVAAYFERFGIDPAALGRAADVAR